MADWDETGPADDDIVSQFPASERAARAAVKTNFGIDHHEDDDGDVGKHEVIQVVDNAADPTIDAGQVGIWNNGGVLSIRTGAAAVQRVVQFPSGTKQVFYQATAPTGWTHDTAVTDRVLMATNGAGGGTTGGTWTISGISTNNHAITIAQLPAHNHNGSTADADGQHNHGGLTGVGGQHDHGGNNAVVPPLGSGSAIEEGGAAPNYAWATISTAGTAHQHGIPTTGNHTHSLSISSVGSNQGHSHGVSHNGNWRPSHANVIVATLD